VNAVIIWAGFVGAWPLVAGPLYQGSIELVELDFDREGIGEIKASATRMTQDRPSAWWWLLPPVMYVLQRRWTKAFQQVLASGCCSLVDVLAGNFAIGHPVALGRAEPPSGGSCPTSSPTTR
jgi:hypothetical protein